MYLGHQDPSRCLVSRSSGLQSHLALRKICETQDLLDIRNAQDNSFGIYGQARETQLSVTFYVMLFSLSLMNRCRNPLLATAQNRKDRYFKLSRQVVFRKLALRTQSDLYLLATLPRQPLDSGVPGFLSVQSRKEPTPTGSKFPLC
jgi:hypothetical protein